MAGRVFKKERTPLECGEPIALYRVGSSPDPRPKWQKALASFEGVCQTIGEPLSENQRTVLAGSFAVWLG